MFLDFPLCNYLSVDTEPGGEEKLVARGIPGFPLCNYFSVDTEPGGTEKLVAHDVRIFLCVIIYQWIRNLVGRKNCWHAAFLDFPLCNYFSVDMELGGEKKLVSRDIPGFSSV